MSKVSRPFRWNFRRHQEGHCCQANLLEYWAGVDFHAPSAPWIASLFRSNYINPLIELAYCNNRGARRFPGPRVTRGPVSRVTPGKPGATRHSRRDTQSRARNLDPNRPYRPYKVRARACANAGAKHQAPSILMPPVGEVHPDARYPAGRGVTLSAGHPIRPDPWSRLVARARDPRGARHLGHGVKILSDGYLKS